MRSKTVRRSARLKSRKEATTQARHVTGSQADGIEPPRKKRKRTVDPQESPSPPSIPSPAVEETAQRLADLRLDRQLLIAETDQGIIKRIGDGEYRLTIPIETLEFFHRSAWGVKDVATEIVINLVLLKREQGVHYGLCVHLGPGDLADKYHHNFITTDSPWRDTIVCNKASNFLTDALSQELHAHLRQSELEDDSVLGEVLFKVQKVASSDPTKSCLICGGKLAMAMWRPSTCSKGDCRQSFKRWSLETRLSPFLRCPKVLDFLLACLYTGNDSAIPPNIQEVYRRAGVSRQAGGFMPPGFTWIKLGSTLDAFPTINNDTTLSELMLSDSDKAAKEKLLAWLCTDFESTLIPAPASAQVGFPQSEQFLILNGPTYREAQVSRGLKRYGKEKSGGVGAFHGTPQHNLFSILHKGLVNSGGAVWYSSQAQYSLGFNGKFQVGELYYGLTGPKNSAFKQKTVLFGVEAVHYGRALTDTDQLNSADEATVALRYAFVLPQDRVKNRGNLTLFPLGSSLRHVMEQTFTEVRSGDMVKKLETEAKKTRST